MIPADIARPSPGGTPTVMEGISQNNHFTSIANGISCKIPPCASALSGSLPDKTGASAIPSATSHRYD